MNHGTSHFDFQLSSLAGFAVVLSKRTNRQDGRFIQALRVNLDGVTNTFGINIRNDAGSHGPESNIFDNFRQLSGVEEEAATTGVMRNAT